MHDRSLIQENGDVTESEGEMYSGGKGGGRRNEEKEGSVTTVPMTEASSNSFDSSRAVSDASVNATSSPLLRSNREEEEGSE